MATYERINWENLPSQETPIDADNLNYMDAAIDTINRELGSVSERVSANAARISEFTALGDGSTTGDAELADGRIGDDGTVYNNIGDAIRSQVESLAQGITENQNGIFAINDRTAYVTSVLADSTKTYPNEETALAALDTYATNKGGNGYYVGYISTSNSTVLGLANTSHYFEFYVNSANYRLLVVYSINADHVYLRAKTNGTWQSAWTELGKQSDVQHLNSLTQGRQYSAISAMYTELTSLLALNQGVWCTATSNLISFLTNSEISKVCRVFVVKADTSVLDYMLFAPGSNAIYIGRINNTSTIVNRNRFALRSDVAGVFWESDSAVKITTSITSNVASHANGVYYLWSTASDATTVGAPSAHAYHYLIVKVNSSAAIIQAHRMTTDGDAFYVKQLYGGNWSSAWTKIPTQAEASKTALSTSQVYANATAETYNYQTISGLSDYAIVLVNVNCANLRQTLTFVNGDTDPQYLYEINGNNKIRGGYSVDWTNNRVGVRYLSAAGAYTYQNVYFTKVVGLLKQ